MRHRRIFLSILLLLSATLAALAEQLSNRYTEQQPLTIVCDWDKAPYEFLDDRGEPSGTNIDVLNIILNRLDIPHKFVMKEWSNALKTFERQDADLILANIQRFKGKDFYFTQIINYNRMLVAMTKDTADIISVKTLEKEGVILKPGDYSVNYFKDVDSIHQQNIEYQSPKVALTSLLSGDGKFFVWGEEPLKWKLKKLNLEGIFLNDVSIPVSEVHIVGRDKELIYQIDDQFSRLKQSGELEAILNKWIHPEKAGYKLPKTYVYSIFAIVLLAVLALTAYWLARRHVIIAMRRSIELETEYIRGQIGALRHRLDFLLSQSSCRLTGKDVTFDTTRLDSKRQHLSELSALARQSSQLKSGFMASMTHELRTPLNAIVGFTGVLREVDNPEERAEYVRIIRNSSDMLQRLINDIIDASSITDNGYLSIQPAPVDFALAFDDICLTLRQRVQNPDVTFIKENPYDTLPTTLDTERVMQIYTNFVTNATKFTRQGHIRVGYRYEQGGLYLYCEDTGIGIPKEKQELIFQRFVKLDDFVQGTGMGLTICQSIVESLHGRIGVMSEGTDKGSTFWAWIPCNIG